MTQNQDSANEKNLKYTRFRPEMYDPPISIFWWMHKKSYIKFILRELTSIFVAAYAVILMVQINALSQGPETWQALMEWFASPLAIVLHIVIFAFVIFHSVTWFNLAPSAMVLKIGKKQIPGSAIIIGNYVMWIILSAAIAWLILGF